MTATAEHAAAAGGADGQNTGRVARVIGPVVDIEFSAQDMPEIYNALHVDVTLEGHTSTLTLEVAQHIGDNTVRAISMRPTDGLVRGATVIDTGGPISVPVGDVTKGHVFNVLGETLDLTLGQLLDQLGRYVGFASPCGRKIEEAASKSKRYLKLPYTVKGNDVSFSGVLTAAKRLIEGGASFEDVCYSVQETAFAITAEVTERALAFTGSLELLVVGGVAANRRLSQMLELMAKRHDAAVKVVPLKYSGDCGAQIAWTGLLAFRSGHFLPHVADSVVRQSWRLDTVPTPWRSG